MYTSILHITNNGDGTYNVQFSAPVTLDHEGTTIGNALFLDARTPNINYVSSATTVDATTVQMTDSGGNATDNYLVFTDQPVDISAAMPFEVIPPDSAIG
jgi:hypothetical protein